MAEPTDVLPGLRASTADLVHELESARWTDADVAAATLLPGWTRGHVLTHLARNADAIAGTLSGAMRGEVVAPYPGGREQRSAAINEGADRSTSALVADVRESASRLDRMLAAVHDAEQWDAPTGDDAPAHSWVLRRWIEVEVHRVDLDGGYRPERWPPLLVATALPGVLDTLADRVAGALQVSADDGPSRTIRGGSQGDGEGVEVRGPGWAVLAWALGRPSVAADALSATPELAPWR